MTTDAKPSDIQRALLACRPLFDSHEITTVVNTEGISRFIFRRPDSGMYGFALTCADNLLVMNGDCYSLLVEPGYGRNGLGFLLSNVCRDPWYYFLSKVPHPFKELTREFSSQKAEANLGYYVNEGYLSEADLDDWEGRDEDGHYGTFKYFEFCHEKNIDEPMEPFELRHQVILQIAGLQRFAEKYRLNHGWTDGDVP